eukprot:TRINITY_DN3832_c0_g1_i4.p1 TRINITY_DN3832_c0_g1~~TRINITY_DN3832_c0_g1_i4.p1  ORF type:complete len:217 (+),score=40.24 TRINITY_DN3832_c0_g1_i4:422-1072(+)
MGLTQVLVSLGEDYFAHQTVPQCERIIDRRVEYLKSRLNQAKPPPEIKKGTGLIKEAAEDEEEEEEQGQFREIVEPYKEEDEDKQITIKTTKSETVPEKKITEEELKRLFDKAYEKARKEHPEDEEVIENNPLKNIIKVNDIKENERKEIKIAEIKEAINPSAKVTPVPATAVPISILKQIVNIYHNCRQNRNQHLPRALKRNPRHPRRCQSSSNQ